MNQQRMQPPKENFVFMQAQVPQQQIPINFFNFKQNEVYDDIKETPDIVKKSPRRPSEVLEIIEEESVEDETVDEKNIDENIDDEIADELKELENEI